MIKADNSNQLSEALREKVVAFNQRHWPVERRTLGFKVEADDGTLIGGISGRCFGNWLLIDWLWVEPEQRSQGYARRLVEQLEQAAGELGARFVALDTLDFQAKPFYEKLGYRVKYQLDGYPLDGARYYMEKAL